MLYIHSANAIYGLIMAGDLTFADLNVALGQTGITVSGSNVTFDLSLIMGEASISLSDEKLAEFLTNILDLAAKAQTTYNAAPANTTKIESYPSAISGIPSRDANGTYYVASTYSFGSKAPLNKAQTTAVTS